MEPLYIKHTFGSAIYFLIIGRCSFFWRLKVHCSIGKSSFGGKKFCLFINFEYCVLNIIQIVLYWGFRLYCPLLSRAGATGPVGPVLARPIFVRKRGRDKL